MRHRPRLTPYFLRTQSQCLSHLCLVDWKSNKEVWSSSRKWKVEKKKRIAESGESRTDLQQKLLSCLTMTSS